MNKKTPSKIRDFAIIAFSLLVGLIFVVIKPMGFDFSAMPGDLGDGRLNSFLLEHFYRWARGWDASFWDVPFFYPFPGTLSFGDSFLGSAPIYAFFRYLGFNREGAFQAWWIVGYILNFVSATYVLKKLDFKPLAVSTGAFFFTFGLPMIAQETHAQLLYRFGIPLAYLALWELLHAPSMRKVVSAVFWLTWQFFLSIYLGIFLLLMLMAMLLLAPISISPSYTNSVKSIFILWKEKLSIAWRDSSKSKRVRSFFMLVALVLAGAFFLFPYYETTKLYGFSRLWGPVGSLLPKWWSYFLADHSYFWKHISKFLVNTPLRHEHQLFPGLIPIILASIGIFYHRKTRARNSLYAHLAILLTLMLFTFSVKVGVKDYSMYVVWWLLPGGNSIRAVARIVLVLMWPFSILVAYGTDVLKRQKSYKLVLVYLLIGLFFAEQVMAEHITYDKTHAQARLQALQQQMPNADLPDEPILFVTGTEGYLTELDAMLVAQQRGWAAFNGYSGNYPPGYKGITTHCISLPKRINAYMAFSGIESESYYQDLMQRAVIVDDTYCDPTWEKENPAYAGVLPEEIFQNLRLSIDTVTTNNGDITAVVDIHNDSNVKIPALSSTEQPFQLYIGLITTTDHKKAPYFGMQERLPSDIHAGTELSLTLQIDPENYSTPQGCYFLEITAEQNNTDNKTNASPSVISTQEIGIDHRRQATLGCQ